MTTKSELDVLSRGNTGKGPSVPPPAGRWKSRVLLPAAILLAFAGLLLYSARDMLWPALPVKIAPAVAKTSAGVAGGVSFQAAGWIEPDPFVIRVSSLIDGVVKELLALEGEQVKAGQAVARLVDEDAKLAVARAEAELNAAKAALKAAQLDWDNPIERTRAADTSAAELAEAQAELQRVDAEIAVESARLGELQQILEREKKAGDAIPEFQSFQTSLRMKTQQAALDSTRQRKPMLQAQARKKEAEALAAKEAARLRVSEQQALAQARANLARAEVELATAKLKLDRTTLYAPAAGVVINQRVAPGHKVMMNSDDHLSLRVMDLYDPKRLQVRVDVPLAESANILLGQLAQITTEAARDRIFNGKVTRIVHEADIQKNTVQVKVAIDKPGAELKPEMLARVQFLAKENPAADNAIQSLRVFAPEAALQRSGAQATVWIVDKGQSTAHQKSVTVGFIRTEGWIEITAGLQPGDALIVGDFVPLREGVRVKIIDEEKNFSTARGGAHHGAPAPKGKDGDND